MRRSCRRRIRRVTIALLIALLVIAIAYFMENRDIRQGRRDRVRLRNLKNGGIYTHVHVCCKWEEERNPPAPACASIRVSIAHTRVLIGYCNLDDRE